MGPLRLVSLLVAAAVGAVALAIALARPGPDPATAHPPAPAGADEPAGLGEPVAAVEPADDPVRQPPVPHGDAAADPTEAPAWGARVTGVTRFRGDLRGAFHGRGPAPDEPSIAWRHPERAMCSTEVVRGVERDWCGIGWTGQPLLWEREDGSTELITGAYDGRIHFLDAATGEPTRQPFRTGFMVKGTDALDPDGFPLLYTGSRDGRFRILALDREPVVELWSMGRHPQGVWNDDWDSSPALLDDVLHVGGEDSWYRAILLERSYDAQGRVQVDPQVLVEVPGFTDELIAAIGDRTVSIESSPVIDVDRQRVYLTNSGGRLFGLDISEVRSGRAPIVFDVWLGDDIDASVALDPDGALYVGIEAERFLPRGREVGQIVKLDPDRPDDPIVWGIPVPPRRAGEVGGVWATPAWHDGVLYVATHPGELLTIDATSGEVLQRDDLGFNAWSSPVVIADGRGEPTLVVGTCFTPGVRGYGIADPRAPVERWRVGLPGCVESTPVVWDGGLWVGSRDGFLYAIR
jgi:outer membrane protein assembly factor BamB